MARQVNTNLFFLPSGAGAPGTVVEKNTCYFNFIFCGGNYYSQGNILQRIFGGRDQVALIVGLRLQADGLTIAETQDPNIVLDKRIIQTGKTTNIPMVLNLLAKIPAYMDTIGFSFKIATLKRTDNFSAALDVLNDDKGIIDGFLPNIVGKALGVGKVVKDMFDKIDAANSQDMLQSAVQDFIITADASVVGSNTLREGFLVVMLKDEKEVVDGDDDGNGEDMENAVMLVSDAAMNVRAVRPENQVFLRQPAIRALVDRSMAVPTAGPVAEVAATPTITFDEANKVLRADGKIVTNTYLVFKVERLDERGENTNAAWSQKLTAAVNTLVNELDKSLQRLQVITPVFTQLFTEGLALLSQDSSFTPLDKNRIRNEYIEKLNTEKAKFH